MAGRVGRFLGDFRGFEPDAKKLVAATVLASIGDTFIWFLLLLYLDVLDYAPSEIGMVIFLRSIFSTLPLMPMGYLSDRIGRRKMIFLGIFVNVIGMALHVTANSLVQFYVAASIWGLAHSLYQPAYLGFLSEKVSEARRKFLFAFQMFSHQMAAAFTILVAGFLPALLTILIPITESDGFKFTFFIGMLFMATQVVPIMLTTKEKRKSEKKAEKKVRYRELPPMPRRTVLKLCVPMVLFGLGAGLFVEFLPVYFVWRFDKSVADIGILYFLTFFIWALMYLPLPTLAEKGGSVKAITAVHSFAIIALLAIPASPIFTLAAMAHITRMVLMNSTWPIFNSYTLGHVPKEHTSLTLSSTSFSFNSMRAITPLAAGYLFGISLALPFLIAAVFYTIAVIAFYVLFIGKEEKGIGGERPSTDSPDAEEIQT
jgi:MFS family permease